MPLRFFSPFHIAVFALLGSCYLQDCLGCIVLPTRQGKKCLLGIPSIELLQMRCGDYGPINLQFNKSSKNTPQHVLKGTCCSKYRTNSFGLSPTCTVQKWCPTTKLGWIFSECRHAQQEFQSLRLNHCKVKPRHEVNCGLMVIYRWFDGGYMMVSWDLPSLNENLKCYSPDSPDGPPLERSLFGASNLGSSHLPHQMYIQHIHQITRT